MLLKAGFSSPFNGVMVAAMVVSRCLPQVPDQGQSP